MVLCDRRGWRVGRFDCAEPVDTPVGTAELCGGEIEGETVADGRGTGTGAEASGDECTEDAGTGAEASGDDWSAGGGGEAPVLEGVGSGGGTTGKAG
jgi:hypothetical protein